MHVLYLLHPYLVAADRAAAFADLLAHPCGSERTWARRWDWHHSRVHRFLHHLTRIGLIHIESTLDGSVVHFRRSTSEAEPQQTRSTTAAPLHINPREVPREKTLGLKNVEKSPAEQLAVRCVDAMNGIGAFRFGGGYLPVRTDQRRSVAATAKWITAGLDPDWCEVEVRRQMMVVRRTPVTLGFCERGVLQAWGDRHQTALPLLQTMRGTAQSAPAAVLAASRTDDRPALRLSDGGGDAGDWRAILAERGILERGETKAGPQKLSELGLASNG